jgi:NADPH-dependent ferric siderophore reductase
MVEKVMNGEQLLAIILRASFVSEGINFFTPPEFSQQLGYMNRPKGYTIGPHKHEIVQRNVTITQEVLFLKQGKLRVDFYGEDHHHVASRVLETGDVILLASGGHGFEMLEKSEIIEVKQGPYYGDQNKIQF